MVIFLKGETGAASLDVIKVERLRTRNDQLSIFLHQHTMLFGTGLIQHNLHTIVYHLIISVSWEAVL